MKQDRLNDLAILSIFRILSRRACKYDDDDVII